MARQQPDTGFAITNVAGTVNKPNTFTIKVKHTKLDSTPYLGDLLIIESENTKWVGRVNSHKYISFGEIEGQLQESIVDEDISEEEKDIYFGEEFEIELVGVLGGVNLSPVIRTLPPRSSVARYPKSAELRQITAFDNMEDGVATLGHYAVGDKEYEDILVKLSVSRFLKRRTAILGQAGYGKSNLIKSVLAEIAYNSHDTAIIIFDRDGEYSFKTEQSVGLCDIKNIRNRITTFTSASRTEQEYAPFIGGEPRFDLRQLRPSEVVAYLFPDERKGRNYAGWLQGIRANELEARWHPLVNLIHADGLDTGIDEIMNLVGPVEGSGTDQTTAAALRSVLTRIVRAYHNPESNFIDAFEEAVEERRVVIVDLARLSQSLAKGVVEIVLSRLFDENEERFISGASTIPLLLMVEEAQNFLSKENVKSESNIVVRIAKEGRKFGFGLIYVTQQPAAIDETILSQTNNFFVMHLLTNGDIRALRESNPNFSASARFIQSEPIRGISYFYSNVYSENGQVRPTPAVFATKVRKFDDVAKAIDELAPSDTWEAINQSFIRDRADVRNQCLKIIRVELDEQSSATIRWGRLWGETNKGLSKENQFKDGYEAKNGNLFVERKIAEKIIRSINSDTSIPFTIRKDNNEYIIQQITQQEEQQDQDDDTPF